jgi:glycosyltransferase involved in cell wall biosynthesis
MKVAILHNYLDTIGGAERVALTLARELDGDLYSTNVDLGKIASMGFNNVKISSIGRVPLNAPYRQQTTSWRFGRLDLHGDYDYHLIDGDWAVAAAQKNKPNMWYVHSPIRELWDLYDYTRQYKVTKISRLAFDIWAAYNRSLNLKHVSHIGKLVCNSENTRLRVKTYLKRSASVVHPPIETSSFHFGRIGDYWLSVNRLTSHKRVELQMDAFRRLPDERLIVVGSFEQSRHFLGYVDYINRIKPANVQLLSFVDFPTLVQYYANCKGFITTALDEDFGMTPVEAMASGKPVIAPNEGGYKESVIDGITGRLIEGINAEKLAQAVKDIGAGPEDYKAACLKRAGDFDTKIFVKKINAEMGL